MKTKLKYGLNLYYFFLPNDNRYELYPLLELKEIPKLQDKLHFIAGMKIPSISAVPKKNWDLHIDLGHKKLNSNSPTDELDKSERNLFNSILNILDRPETDENVNS